MAYIFHTEKSEKRSNPLFCFVNHDFVTKYTYDSVELLDGACLPISKANRKKVREQILREDWNGDK